MGDALMMSTDGTVPEAPVTVQTVAPVFAFKPKIWLALVVAVLCVPATTRSCAGVKPALLKAFNCTLALAVNGTLAGLTIQSNAPVPELIAYTKSSCAGTYTTSCPIELSAPSITAARPATVPPMLTGGVIGTPVLALMSKTSLLLPVTMLVPGFNPGGARLAARVLTTHTAWYWVVALGMAVTSGTTAEAFVAQAPVPLVAVPQTVE